MPVRCVEMETVNFVYFVRKREKLMKWILADFEPRDTDGKIKRELNLMSERN